MTRATVVLVLALVVGSAHAESPPPDTSPCTEPGFVRNQNYNCAGWIPGPRLNVARHGLRFVHAFGLVWVVDGKDLRGRAVTVVESLAPDATHWELRGDWLEPKSIAPSQLHVPVIAYGPDGARELSLPSLATAAATTTMMVPDGVTPVLQARFAHQIATVGWRGGQLVVACYDNDDYAWSTVTPLEGFDSLRGFAVPTPKFLVLQEAFPGAYVLGDAGGRLRVAALDTKGEVMKQRTFDIASDAAAAPIYHDLQFAMVGERPNDAEPTMLVWEPAGDSIHVGPKPRFIGHPQAIIELRYDRILVSDGDASAIVIW